MKATGGWTVEGCRRGRRKGEREMRWWTRCEESEEGERDGGRAVGVE